MWGENPKNGMQFTIAIQDSIGSSLLVDKSDMKYLPWDHTQVGKTVAQNSQNSGEFRTSYLLIVF